MTNDPRGKEAFPMQKLMNPHPGSMRRKAAIAGVTLLVSLAAPSVVHADWISSTQDDRCDPQDIEAVTTNIRAAIEASVRRAEASIAAPMAIGDLSCLNDLMNAPLDIFSNIGGLMGSLQAGLLSSVSFPMDLDVSGMLCDFAAEKWGELTGGLGGMDISLDGFAMTPASMGDRLAGGGGFGGSGLNIPGFNGTVNTEGNAPTGSEVTEIGVSPEVEARPLYPTVPDDVPEGFVFDEASFNAAAAAYENASTSAMVEYIACRTAQRLNNGWDPQNWQPIICNAPNTGTPPDVNDYIVSAPAQQQATQPWAAPTARPMAVPRAQAAPTPAPSELIQAPAQPSATPDRGGNPAARIWENM